MRFAMICAGGAIGTGARYLTALWAASAFGVDFPVGTLIVNLAGSFLIAFIMHLSSVLSISTDVRLMLTTGVMGGFTTYSAFNYETTGFLRAGAWGTGVVNVFATVLGCLVAGFLGLVVARVVVGR